MLGTFRELSDAGQTILMATHEVRAACCGDRIVYLRDGEVISELRLEVDSTGEDEREALLLEWLSGQGW